MARLRHPNLVQYLGMSTKKGPSGNLIPGWIVTELMETSLYNLLHEQHLKLTLFEVVHVATQIARGLQVPISRVSSFLLVFYPHTSPPLRLAVLTHSQPTDLAS